MNPGSEMPRIRGVALHPVADIGLPLALNLQSALAVALLGATASAVAGRPLLPGLGWWALLLATESFLFTGFFFVRELDMPRLLRRVEAAVILLLAKVVATAPATGWGLAALTELTTLEPWIGMPLLAAAWSLGMQAAHLCGALHPGLLPDLGAESLRQNPHGEAFDALRRRVLATAGWAAALIGLVPVLAAGEASTRWIGLGLTTLALLAVAALAQGARLKKEIDWALERLHPPAGVLSRWLPQSVALMLMPFLLALFLPAGPRLPLERLIPAQVPQEYRVEFDPPSQPGGISPIAPFQEWMEQVAPVVVTLPTWLRWVAYGLATLAVTGLALAILSAAWRQLADRLGGDGGRGVLPLLRALLRWYAALWQALWAGLRGGVAMAGRGAAETARAVLGEAGVLGRRLPIWRRPPGEPRAAVRYYFARLQADAARQGLVRPKGGTAAEFAASLAEAVPEQGEEIAALLDTYQQARYGPEEVAGEDASRSRRAWILIAKGLGRR